jgi:phosphatidate phosphatase APP1
MDWQKPVARILNRVEETFDRLQYRLKGEQIRKGNLAIIAYRGFGASRSIYIKGRVLWDKRIHPSKEEDDLWDNLANMYRRFESDEVPGARLTARYQTVQAEAMTDSEGFFELFLELPAPLPAAPAWQTVQLELLDPRPLDGLTVQAQAEILSINPRAQYGVISDIDDTILVTHTTNPMRMGPTILFNNARTRQGFPGVSSFYQALQRGTLGVPVNPLFYVSSSPWNLYDLLVEFMQLQGIPSGPMVSLRDWGITELEFLPTRHRQHKLSAIRMILDLLPHLSFLLIGDSGQEDPQIYREVVQSYPRRVLGVYIRNVSQSRRQGAVLRQAEGEINMAGSAFLLAADTQEMARHAARQGWIDA